MAGEYSEKIPLTRAVVIFLAAAFLIIGLCFIIGEIFFWDQYDTVDPIDKDIEYFSSIAARDKDNDDAMVELGWRYYRKGNYQEASRLFLRAVEVNSVNVAAHFNLALCYSEISLPGKAEEEFKKVLQFDPDHRLAPYYMGKMFLEQERYEEAVRYLLRAAEADPASADAVFLLGKAYEARGYNAEALAYYERTLKLIPDHPKAEKAYERLKK